MKNRIALPIVLVVLLGMCAGCISTDRTEYRDESRLNVEFENDTAGRLFYETLSQNHYSRSESNTEVSLPIIFEHKHRVVEGESIAFNQAVRRCDTNGDGLITEQEARIFAGQAGKN
jgi:hypothetical protein